LKAPFTGRSYSRTASACGVTGQLFKHSQYSALVFMATAP
jgi:hypothetical protein